MWHRKHCIEYLDIWIPWLFPRGAIEGFHDAMMRYYYYLGMVYAYRIQDTDEPLYWAQSQYHNSIISLLLLLRTTSVLLLRYLLQSLLSSLMDYALGPLLERPWFYECLVAFWSVTPRRGGQICWCHGNLKYICKEETLLKVRDRAQDRSDHGKLPRKPVCPWLRGFLRINNQKYGGSTLAFLSSH